MAEIIISHRRDDAPVYVGRLYDLLAAHFGAERVSRDVAEVAPGSDWADAVERAVGSCEILIVVIGNDWLAADSTGRRRLDNPGDIVRRETAAALARGIHVVPVLVEGAEMPRADQLPAELAPLALRNALDLRHQRWDANSTELIRALESMLSRGIPAASAPNPVPMEPSAPASFDVRMRASHSDPATIERVRSYFGLGPTLGERIRSGLGRLLKRATRNGVATPDPETGTPLDIPTQTGPLSPDLADPVPVLLGASVPACASPSEEFSARFVAYIAEEEEKVLETLRRLSPRATSHPGLKTCRWRVGTRVQVTLRGNWLHVANPVQDFVWQGSRVLLDFEVQVADDAPEGTTSLKLDVVIDDIAVAPMWIDLGVGTSARQGAVYTTKTEAARTAFASYASPDRTRVLDRVAAVRISAGLDVFLDCLSLHPGEAWKPRLADKIRARDLFPLFWTAAAADSKWVTWEWQTALAAKGTNGLQVHPLESGIAPPEQLKDLHFGDVIMLIRDASARPAGRHE